MSYTATSIATIHKLFDHYGHDVDKITQRDLSRWKLIHGQFQLTAEMADAIASEMAAEYDTISDTDAVYQRFVETATKVCMSKNRVVETTAKKACKHCRNKGLASIIDPINRASTRSVICFCPYGGFYAEKCATSKTPQNLVSALADESVKQDVEFFTSLREEASRDWDKRNGLRQGDPEYPQKWRGIMDEMKGQMFRSANEADPEKAKATHTARRLTQILRVRPVPVTDIPDGWEAVIYLGSGVCQPMPVVDGFIQPHPHGRVQKKR
jgi:hypothetical protein